MRQIVLVGRGIASAAIVLGVALAPRVSTAQDKPPAGQDKPAAGDTAPAAAAAQLLTATFTVKKIDKKDHTLTLNDPQGNTVDVKAGPDVDLDKIRTGERLDVSYYEEVALAIQKPGEAPPKVALKGAERPGVAEKQMTVAAKIVKVDADKNTVTVRTPSGDTHAIHVHDAALQDKLRNVKAGEDLQITYTQAVAVTVKPKK